MKRRWRVCRHCSIKRRWFPKEPERTSIHYIRPRLPRTVLFTTKVYKEHSWSPLSHLLEMFLSSTTRGSTMIRNFNMKYLWFDQLWIWNLLRIHLYPIPWLHLMSRLLWTFGILCYMIVSFITHEIKEWKYTFNTKYFSLCRKRWTSKRAQNCSLWNEIAVHRTHLKTKWLRTEWWQI